MDVCEVFEWVSGQDASSIARHSLGGKQSDAVSQNLPKSYTHH